VSIKSQTFFSFFFKQCHQKESTIKEDKKKTKNNTSKCFKDGGGGYHLPLVVALVNVKLRMDE